MDSSGDLEKQQQKKEIDSFEIFNSIIKDDEFSEEEYRRDTRKRIIIIVFSMIVLVMIIVGATIGILTPQYRKEHSTNQNNSIEKMCNSTLYRESCSSSITSLNMTSNKSASNTPEDIFMLSLQVTHNELIKLQSSIHEKLVLLSQGDEVNTKNALSTCQDLVQDAVREVNMSISSFQHRQNDESLKHVISDIRMWLSAAITDQETCLDGLMDQSRNISHSLQEEMKVKMQNSTEFISNSLAIISNMYRNVQQFQVPTRKRLFEERLLNEGSLVLDVTVAKDGSSNYMKTGDAVNAMPKRSKTMFLVYVKRQ